MDPIKEAFIRAKNDISTIQQQIEVLSQEVTELKELIRTYIQHNSPFQQTNTPSSPNKPTQLTEPYLKTTQNSTGNEGVPTDKQTNRQTNQHTGNEGVSASEQPQSLIPTNKPTQLTELSSTLTQLTQLSSEAKSQLASLTKQEVLIYASIYQRSEEGKLTDYETLAQQTKLTETSIRDYIFKITKKGLPLIKTKQNNKKIYLNIPSTYKQLVSLQTISSYYQNK